MPKKIILYISHSPYLNGAEVCLLNLVRNLDRDKYEPVVVFPADGPLRQKCVELQVETYVTPLEWWIRFRSDYFLTAIPLAQRIEKLLRIVDDLKPDIIHTNTSIVLEGALAARARGIPHVWHLHEILDGHPDLLSLLTLTETYKAIGQLGQRVVAVSNSFSRHYLEEVPTSKRKVIYNGIETPVSSAEAKDRIRQEFGFLPGELMALSVGSLSLYKDHGNLLRAAALVAQQPGNIKFLVAGGGSPRTLEALEEQAEAAGLRDKVLFLGHRSDVPDLLAACDLFVLPSRREAFPLGVLEAMALGKPVVATDCGGTREMIRDGYDGFIVPVGDPEALAGKILDLISVPGGITRFGQHARESFQSRFTVSQYVAHFESLYESVCEDDASLFAGNDSMDKALEEALWQVEELATIFREGDAFRRQVRELENQVETLRGEVESLRGELGCLYNSASWKVTAPLRRVNTLLGGKEN